MYPNKDLSSNIRSKRAKNFLAIDFHDLSEITDTHLHISSKRMENPAYKVKSSSLKSQLPLKKASATSKPLNFWAHPFPSTKKTPVLNQIRNYKRTEKALAILPFRIAAFFIDILVLNAPILLYLYYASIQNSVNFTALFISPISLFIPLLLLFYFLFTEGFGGQSIGKMLMKIEIVENNNYRKPIGLRLAAIRLIYFLMGLLFFGLGLVSALRDSNFRAWHDRATRSLVYRRKNV